MQWFVTGNVINIQTGKWSGFMSGLGAGLDSFYEYLLKVIAYSINQFLMAECTIKFVDYCLVVLKFDCLID